VSGGSLLGHPNVLRGAGVIYSHEGEPSHTSRAWRGAKALKRAVRDRLWTTAGAPSGVAAPVSVGWFKAGLD
jgi:hypothetical protein